MSSKRRGRPKIQDKIWRIIEDTVRANLNKSPEQRKLQKELVTDLESNKELRNILKNNNLPMPATGTLGKWVSSCTANLINPAPEDLPWSLGSLEHYPISSENLPFIVRIWHDNMQTENPVTIRRAKWLDRLEVLRKDGLLKDSDADLYHRARLYAFYEKMESINGVFNSNNYDGSLFYSTFGIKGISKLKRKEASPN
jgi:hypothetical protein